MRCDTPADFDRVVRLKELVTGNADSRQEINGSITLAAIQESRRQVQARLDSIRANPALAGSEKVSRDPSDVVPAAFERVAPAELERATPGELERATPVEFAHATPDDGGDDGAGD